MKKISVLKRLSALAISLAMCLSLPVTSGVADVKTMAVQKTGTIFEHPGKDIKVYHQTSNTLPASDDEITSSAISADKNHYYILDSQKGKVTRTGIVATTNTRSSAVSALDFVKTQYNNGYKVTVKPKSAVSYTGSTVNLGVFGGGIRIGLYNTEDGDPYSENGNKTIDRTPDDAITTYTASDGSTKNGYGPVNAISKIDVSEFADGYLNLTINVHDAATSTDYFDYDNYYISLGSGLSSWYIQDTYIVSRTDKWVAPKWYETFRGVPINDYINENDKAKMKNGEDIIVSIPVSEFTKELKFDESSYPIDSSNSNGLNQAGLTDDGRLVANYFPGTSTPDPVFDLSKLQFVGALWYKAGKTADDYDSTCGSNSYITIKNVSFSNTQDISVNFEKSDDEKSITVNTGFTENMAGMLVYALYNTNGNLADVKIQDIAASGKKTYTFKNCSDGQKIKLFLLNNINKLTPISTVTEVNTEDISAPPDVLRVNENGYLAKKDGTAVQLKGVNFGGWLLQETWMCPVLSGDNSMKLAQYDTGWAMLDTLNMLETKLGKTDADTLIQAYQDNYITEADFKNVKNLGFNCVRIPFWYRNFMSDENGTYITDNDNDNPGFKKLDWACDMADKYGLYLILDMHGCPGGQSGDHSTGKTGRNYLYDKPKYQDIMEDLWVKIADRYKDKECVAVYDIMNEPMNNANEYHKVESAYRYTPDTEKAISATIKLYDRMIKAVRSVDPYHVITVEGIWDVQNLPDPDEMGHGWTDIMYQGHFYDAKGTFNWRVDCLETLRKNYGVATLVGEFSPTSYNSSTDDAKACFTKLNNTKTSYTLWNYKVTSFVNSAYTTWGLYNKNYPYDDLYNMCSYKSGFWTLNFMGDINKSYGEDGDNDGFFSFKHLSADQIKQFYTNLWTNSNLATSGFTLNETLYNMTK